MDERLLISSLSNIPIHGANNKLCIVQDTYQQKLLMTYIINKSFLNNVNTCELFIFTNDVKHGNAIIFKKTHSTPTFTYN